MNLMVAIDERFDAGIPTVGDMSAKEFVEKIVHYRLISLNQKEIDQVKDGLSFGDVLQTMKNFKEDGTKELISTGEIPVDEFKNLFAIEYSNTPALKTDEEDIVYNLFGMLEDVSFEKKIPVSFYEPQSEQMIVKDIGLKDVL